MAVTDLDDPVSVPLPEREDEVPKRYRYFVAPETEEHENVVDLPLEFANACGADGASTPSAGVVTWAKLDHADQPPSTNAAH